MSKDIKLKIIIDQAGNATAGIKGLIAGIGGLLLIKQGIEALGGVIADSVGKASDLSAQMSTIGARSNATAGEVEDLKNLVSDLALDPDLKVSAFEAAAAIEELAAGGVAIEDIMSGAAEGTVALANAVGGDFGQAAEVAASSMAIFGVKAEDMTSVVDGVTAVVVASKFDLNDYALALAQAGGAAQTSGVEMEDFNTALVAIAPLFASGSDAGTSFKVMLQRLVGGSGPAIEAMKKVGIITDDAGKAFQFLVDHGITPASHKTGDLYNALTKYAAASGMAKEEAGKFADDLINVNNRFFDSEGSLRSMAEISGVLQETLGGLSEQQRNSALQTIFGTDAMRAAVGLMKEGEAGFTALQATMAETSGAEAAAMMMDNLAGDSEILKGVVEGLQISYGDKLMPRLRELAQFATGYLTENGPAFVESFAALSISVLNLAQEAIPQIIAQFQAFSAKMSATVGPAMLLINDALDRMAVVFGMNAGETDLLDVALGGLKMTLDAVVIAVQVVALAFQAAAWYVETWSKILTTAKAISDGYGSAIRSMASGVSSALNSVVNAWKGLISVMKAAASAIPKALMPGSPTPFELGLRGIAGAAGSVAKVVPGMMGGAAAPGPTPALAGAGAQGGGGAGGIVINFTYSPVISLADRFEAENVLAPFIANGVRLALQGRGGK